MTRWRPQADALFQEAIATATVPGVVAMVADAQGLLYEGAFGLRALDAPAAMTADTVFWVASMTKPMTTALALQLVEAGQLQLDGPVQDALPEIGQLPVCEGQDEGGVWRLRPPRRPITLRQLLSHTSGLAYEFWSETLVRYRKAHGLPSMGSGRRAAMDLPLVFDPGERWEYGIGIDWAGLLVERVTGQRLDVALQERLLGPLGLRDSSLAPPAALRARLAKVHQRDAGGVLAVTPVAVPEAPEVRMGGSDLHTSGADYLRFLRMILQGGQLDGVRVLADASVALMGQPQTGGCPIRPLRSALPRVAGDLDVFPGVDKSFGLGFLLLREASPTGLTPGTMLWSGLANTYFWIEPARGRAAVLLTQVLPYADPRVAALLARFQRIVAAG
jgi:CubicO group peptidase (beta-lactamase class C family)